MKVYETENSVVKCVNPGHLYEVELPNDGGKTMMPIAVQVVFQEGAVKEVGGRNGMQNEEIIAVLIHRLNFLQEKFPCRENEVAITSLEIALLALEARTSRRKFEGVEGKDINHGVGG